MQQSNELESENSSVEIYLQSGTQTQITPNILERVSTIEGTVIDKTQQILNKVALLEHREFDEEVFRKRTGSQIIEDNYVTGCTDFALAFITFARASGIPTKYVETIDEQWLREGGNSIQGHIYSQVYDDVQNKWIWVDPMNMRIDCTPRNRVIFKEGLDSWDIGIKDFDTLKSEFEKFRKEWLLDSSSI